MPSEHLPVYIRDCLPSKMPSELCRLPSRDCFPPRDCLPPMDCLLKCHQSICSYHHPSPEKTGDRLHLQITPANASIAVQATGISVREYLNDRAFQVREYSNDRASQVREYSK
jgi:hypothetical protein